MTTPHALRIEPGGPGLWRIAAGCHQAMQRTLQTINLKQAFERLGLIWNKASDNRIDLRNLDKVLEVDKISRAARIQAGVYGPALDAQLKPHGLTLRHFPQSYEFSTLGGWIATRSGGHFVMLYTHIDDLVESLRVVSP
ncbi:MAG: FAD-dependent oxidoreductase, partial [Proteobacteria bacterium]|nr:FAD-dependent oxidoreductase [Pseudomonadota bacterium]